MGSQSDIKSQPKFSRRATLGLGEFVDRRGEIERAVARDYFWKSLSVIVPESLAELLNSEIVEQARTLKDRAEANDGAEDLWASHVAKWSLKWNLASDAITKDAIRALGVAVQRDGSEDPLQQVPLDSESIRTVMWNISPGPKILFGGRPRYSTWNPLDLDLLDEDGEPGLTWDPLTESRSDAETRNRGIFERLFREAMDKREREYREERTKQAREKRNLQHFDWLVRYQVRLESFNGIAKATGLDRRGVTNAIKDTAEIVGLELRNKVISGR